MRQTATISLAVISCLFISGCSSSPDSIEPTYVSPLEYQSYDCGQLGGEMQRVGRRVQEVAGHQADEAEGDAVAMGVGLVLFWPALFFLIGDDREEELSRLKGEADALEQAAIDKNCANLLEQIKQEREAAEKRTRAEKEQERE